jgi:hypothetical protein
MHYMIIEVNVIASENPPCDHNSKNLYTCRSLSKNVKKSKKKIDVSDFYSVNIKYLYKLIVKSDKICNLKLKYYFL